MNKERLCPNPNGYCFNCGEKCQTRKVFYSHNQECVDKYELLKSERNREKTRRYYSDNKSIRQRVYELEEENQQLIDELNEVYRKLEELELQNKSQRALEGPRMVPRQQPLRT